MEEVARISPSRRLDHLRGGTQAVRVPGGFLTATHEVALTQGLGRTYLHRFLLIDEGFAPRATTEPFFLLERGVEFAAGLLANPDRDELVLSFGVRDRSAHLARLSLARVMASLDEL